MKRAIQLAALTLFTNAPLFAAYPTGPEITDRDAPGGITLRLADWAYLPKSIASPTGQVTRINSLRAEPVASLSASRLLVNDQQGSLYFLNRSTRAVTTYLNFNTLLGPTFYTASGHGAGLVSLAFDPAYATTGKFYTVHGEFDSATSQHRSVVTEWADTNINDAVFTGTRATLLTVDAPTAYHQVGEIGFNPAATSPAHPDYRRLYIASGDGGTGENLATRDTPQMLGSRLGKILRVTPALSGTPGTYTIPTDNPFRTIAGAAPEIYSLGYRNPHRLQWTTTSNATHLLTSDIGGGLYEEVNFVTPGSNAGWPYVEGTMTLTAAGPVNTPPPATLSMFVTNPAQSLGSMPHTFPAALYSHRDGDAIAGGFVYQGTGIPQLRGKFVFGDITTARLFWCDFNDMIAATSDANPDTVADIHELKLFYDNPADASGPVPTRLFDAVRRAYDARNELAVGTTSLAGTVDNDPLPGYGPTAAGNDPYGVPYGGGRSDIRFALIDNELFVLSKSDGAIRRLFSAAGDTNLDGTVDFADLLILAQNYRATRWRQPRAGVTPGDAQ
jgi:glucose/arabinose dehydrogenase